MPWTKEQKKEARKRKKEEQLLKQQELSKKMLAVAPPSKEQRKPIKKEDLGKTSIDHGGHQRALDFLQPGDLHGEIRLSMSGVTESTTEEPIQDPTKVGTFTIGMVYDGDWKAKSKIAGNGKRVRCLKSDQYMEFLLACKAMLMPMLHKTLQIHFDDTFRVNILCGARTQAHTDSFRGNTPNMMYIVGKPGQDTGYLCYDSFPKFKGSVVKMDGRLYVPHGYSQAGNQLKLIGEDPNRPGLPMYYVFPASYIDRLEPYGDLDLAVVGWTVERGLVDVVDDFGEVTIYRKPLVFNGLKWHQIIALAEQKRVYKKPRIRVRKMEKVNVWHEFKAYNYRHWWLGNPLTVRYHAFFRSIREHCPSSNINRTGDKLINYIVVPAGDSSHSRSSLFHRCQALRKTLA